jgi:hypothetical protein
MEFSDLLERVTGLDEQLFGEFAADELDAERSSSRRDSRG